MEEEHALKRMLDIQKFVQNKRLQSLLEQVGAKYGLSGCSCELSDDELELFAAGDPTSIASGIKKEKEKKGEGK